MATVHAGNAGPILAIDLGGSLIRVAHVSSDLTVAHREVIPTMPALGGQPFTAQVVVFGTSSALGFDLSNGLLGTFGY